MKTYSIKEVEIIIRMFIHGSHVTSLLVPVAVIVVCHHVDPVEVAGDLWHVVPGVHDGLAGAHGSGQQQALGLEGRRQLSYPGSEGLLVLVPLLLALSLGQR